MRRALEKYFDIKPIVALGVTDVAQSIKNRAKKLNLTPAQVALFYKKEFFKHMEALNILPPHIKLHVSEHMRSIREFVEVLQKKELAYEKNGNIVFPIKSDKNYGRFRSIEMEGEGQDIEFVLWRGKEPGWHVECSAMASHIFGSHIDIHSGGSDLLFPHHENEEALSTCYHNCDQWVNYWVHSGLLSIADEKMSKSLGNILSIGDFLHTNTSDHLRMLCMMNSYRTHIKYETEKLKESMKVCEKIQIFLALSHLYLLGQYPKGRFNEAELLKDVEVAKSRIVHHIKNDFATDAALKEVVVLLKKVLSNFGEESESKSSRANLAVHTVQEFVKDFLTTFGFSLAESRGTNSNPVEDVIDAVVNFRMGIRSNVTRDPNFKVPLRLCDGFRADFAKLGITITDLPHQCYWICQSRNEMNDRQFLDKLITTAVTFRGAIMNFVKKSEAPGRELLIDECRSLKYHLSNLGIVLIDGEGSHTWTYSHSNDLQAAKYNLIVKQMLGFLERVDQVAGKMNKENMRESKQTLQMLHKTAIITLKSFGLRVDSDGEIMCDADNNPRGESILQKVIDIFVHCFDCVESLIFISQKGRVQMLRRINKVSARSLQTKGFNIKKDYISVLPSWTINGGINNIELFAQMVEEIVMYTCKLKRIAEGQEDLIYKNAIMSIHDSVLQDLEDTGVVVEKEPDPYSWRFKDISMYRKYTFRENYEVREVTFGPCQKCRK